MTITHDKRRITVRDVVTGAMPVPIASDQDPTGALDGLIEWLRKKGLQRRARRIVQRAFSGASRIGKADQDRYAVTAVVRSDGVLEIWLMSRNWRTITITSRFRRVHMVHDDQGHLAAAIPARELAETVAVMATVNA